MQIRVVCPGCKSTFLLAATLAGKALRCAQCQMVFKTAPPRHEPPIAPVTLVEESPPPTVTLVEDDDKGVRNRPPRTPQPRPVPADNAGRHPSPGGGRRGERAPRPVRPGPKKQGGAGLWFIVTFLLLGSFVLIGGGVTVAGYLYSSGPPTHQVADLNAGPVGPPDEKPPPKETSPAEPPDKPKDPPETPKTPPAQPVDVIAGDGTLPAETLALLKAVTAFIKVEFTAPGLGKLAGSGSGFLIKADGETGLVVTNHHVVTPPTDSRLSPAGPPTVVFWSGTKKEQAVSAEVVATDPERDLAVLRVTGIKNLPRPIDLTQKPNLVETMPVYIFGFPFGEALSTTKGNPGMTVGRGSISSLRENEFGETTVVQLDGDINTGNSGGPVLDKQGRLVGVSVARIRGSHIGLAVPAVELQRLLLGRVGVISLTSRKVAGGSEVRVEARLIDPAGQVRLVNVLYALAQPGQEPLKADANGRWPALPGSQIVELRLEPQKAVGTFRPRADKGQVTYSVQAQYVNGAGETVFTQPRPVTIDLTGGSPPVAVNPPPVVGGEKGDQQALPSSVDDVCVGGGGRFIVMHLPKTRQIAIFDAREGKVVKYLAVAEDNVKIAAGLDKLMVVLPDKNLVQRWSLESFEREASAPTPPAAGTVELALMGSASRGPLVLFGPGQRYGPDEVVLVDPETLKQTKVKTPLKHWAARETFWRISGDGRLLTAYNPGSSPQGHTIHIRTGDGFKPHHLAAKDPAGHLVPGPEGRYVYNARGVFTAEGKPVGKEGSYSDGSRFCLPAAEGEAFYLRIDVTGFPHGGGDRGGRKLYLHLSGDDRPVAEIPGVEMPPNLNTWGREPFGTDKRFFLIPSAKLLVVLPNTMDRLLLYKVDVEEMLSKSPFDYLVVLSRPPEEATRGKPFSYAPVVKSKKGGVKIKLESGPPGMKVTPEAQVTWDVPGDFADADVDVILGVSDAGGAETFHTFKLRVGSKAVLGEMP